MWSRWSVCCGNVEIFSKRKRRIIKGESREKKCIKVTTSRSSSRLVSPLSRHRHAIVFFVVELESFPENEFTLEKIRVCLKFCQAFQLYSLKFSHVPLIVEEHTHCLLAAVLQRFWRSPDNVHTHGTLPPPPPHMLY